VDVTTRNAGVQLVALGGPTFQAYLSDVTDFTSSNRWVRAIYVSNTNTDVGVNVYLTPAFFPVGPVFPVVVEWTNLLGTASNNLYLYDDFGVTTNFEILPDITHGFPITGVPWNYAEVAAFGDPISLFRSQPGFAIPFGATRQTPLVIPPGTFDPAGPFVLQLATNQWSAYEAVLRPTSIELEGTDTLDITNAPGRVELRSSVLDISHSQLTAENYVLLSATNHFIGSTGTAVVTPWEDLDLRSTNGLLVLSNTLANAIVRPEGIIDLFSARWTNVTTNTGIALTNHYHVLFVDSKTAPTAPVRSQTLFLHSTNLAGGPDNLIFNDLVTATRNVLLDTERFTIATNDPFTAAIPNGVLNIVDAGIVWTTVTPRLQYFTNNGAFGAVNAVFFGGTRTSPFLSTLVLDPYQAFVNTGRITNFSSQIQANYFQDSGVVDATGGAINLQSQVAILTNGAFLATGGLIIGATNFFGTGTAVAGAGGPISITANSLFVSNHVLAAGAAITISSPNVDDGSLAFNSADFVTNKNVWFAGNGVNYLTPPTLGSLLATMVTNIAPVQKNVINKWAGVDLGNDPSGFFNNAGLGLLVLDGGSNSVFTFSAATGNNALYVDLIELKDEAARQAANGRFAGLATTPGMKVYFGGAVQGGVPVAEKLAAATPRILLGLEFQLRLFLLNQRDDQRQPRPGEYRSLFLAGSAPGNFGAATLQHKLGAGDQPESARHSGATAKPKRQRQFIGAIQGPGDWHPGPGLPVAARRNQPGRYRHELDYPVGNTGRRRHVPRRRFERRECHRQCGSIPGDKRSACHHDPAAKPIGPTGQQSHVHS